MKKSFFFIFFFFCALQLIYSQEDGVVSFAIPVRNSLKYNRFIINPTFSFVREQNSYVTLYNKRQWVQFDNAPLTYFVSYSGRFLESEGIGLSLFQQNYGVLTTFGGVVNFAHNVILEEDSYLTFGLNAGFYKSGVNKSAVVSNFSDPSLEKIPSNTLISVSPGINYGTAYFDFGLAYNNAVLYNLKNSKLVPNDPEKSIQAHIMYTGYIYTDGFFDTSKFVGLVKVEKKTEKTVISGLALLNVPKGIWVQTGYNTQFGLSAGLGLNITKNIALEYNFEKSTGNFSNFGASHEITFAYKFKSEKYDNIDEDDEETSLFSSDEKKSKVVAVKKESENIRVSPIDLQKLKEMKEALALKKEEERLSKLKEAADANAKEIANAKAIATAKQKADADKIIADAKAKEEQEQANARGIADAKAKSIADAKAKADADKIVADAKAKEEQEQANARGIADAKAKAIADAKAKADADKAIADANTKVIADAKAKAIADAKIKADADKATADANAKVIADAKAKAIADAKAKADADKAIADANAKVIADAKAKAIADAKAKADADKAIADANAKVIADAKAKADADRAIADAKAKAIADAKAKADADKAIADAKAKADAEKVIADANARAIADAKAKAIADAKAEADKALAEAKAKADAQNALNVSNQAQNELLTQFRNAVDSKQKELAALKKKNDDFDNGIENKTPDAPPSIGGNKELDALKNKFTESIEGQRLSLEDLQRQYADGLKRAPNKNDPQNLAIQAKIDALRNELAKSEAASDNLNATIASIKSGFDIENKRRIRQAVSTTGQGRYEQDLATLNRIKETTKISATPLKPEDFDFGNEQSNMQIIKNVKNVESGYYLSIAVHTDVAKRDAFVTKAVAAGEKDINYFFDNKSGSYFIYYSKFESLQEAQSALSTKGSKPYNGKMVLIRIENK
jgi:type IX secretion system PorP/SprF family membrane protein